MTQFETLEPEVKFEKFSHPWKGYRESLIRNNQDNLGISDFFSKEGIDQINKLMKEDLTYIREDTPFEEIKKHNKNILLLFNFLNVFMGLKTFGFFCLYNVACKHVYLRRMEKSYDVGYYVTRQASVYGHEEKQFVRTNLFLDKTTTGFSYSLVFFRDYTMLGKNCAEFSVNIFNKNIGRDFMQFYKNFKQG